MRLIRGSALAAVSAFWLSAASATGTVPSPTDNSLLKGAACAKPSNCWAVGSFQTTTGGGFNQALRWNGKHWRQAKIPQPGGKLSTENNALDAISCPAASDCWAVGSYNKDGAKNEVLHWNGKRWSNVRVPQPAGHGSGAVNLLDGVACTSRSDCWAVGVFTGRSAAFLNETLHWNGARWSQISAPNPGGTGTDAFNILEGVSCVSPSDCWAAGDIETSAYFNVVLHWNGNRWAKTKVPQPGHNSGSNLTSISCPSASACFAVGEFNTSGGATLNEALSWHGKKWVRYRTPQPGGSASNHQSHLTSVSCTSNTRCWALGYFARGSSAANLSEALRFTGEKWRRVKTPQPGGRNTGNDTEPMGVYCASASACRAVGMVGNGTTLLNLALRWNGKDWATN